MGDVLQGDVLQEELDEKDEQPELDDLRHVEDVLEDELPLEDVQLVAARQVAQLVLAYQLHVAELDVLGDESLEAALLEAAQSWVEQAVDELQEDEPPEGDVVVVHQPEEDEPREDEPLGAELPEDELPLDVDDQ